MDTKKAWERVRQWVANGNETWASGRVVALCLADLDHRLDAMDKPDPPDTPPDRDAIPYWDRPENQKDEPDRDAVRRMAEDHVDFILGAARPLMIEEFVHGYKHGEAAP